MLPLGNIIRKYGISFHCYADDTQLYISTKPDETSKLSKLTECVKNIKDWMTSNFLLLNSDKTEILLIGPKKQFSLWLSTEVVAFSPRPHPYLPCFAPLSRERLSLHCSPN